MEPFISRINAWLRGHSSVRTGVLFILVVLSAFELKAIATGLKTAYFEKDVAINYKDGKVVRETEIASVEEIEPWMTFGYVSFLFGLPENYLRAALSIHEDRYPNVQIARYARMNDIPLDELVEKVRTAVSNYVPGTF